jgi:hypothetical protein
LGNAEIKDALDRLDELTQEEALAAAAQALHEVSRVAGRVEYVERNMEIIESRVEGLEQGKMDALSILDSKQYPLISHLLNPNNAGRSDRKARERTV